MIDAYQFWGPGGSGGLDRPTAEGEMVDLVKSIASYARTTRGKTDFLVVPQNAAELGPAHPDYLAAVSGIGAEDTWYNDNTPLPSSNVASTVADLNVFKAAGKPVLVIDYVTQAPLIDDFYAKAEAKGYLPYASTRALDQLTLNAGHVPSCGPVPGDLNGDGRVDAEDLSVAFRIFLGALKATPAQLAAGDVRPHPPGGPMGDGRIGADDLNWIFRRVLGLEALP